MAVPQWIQLSGSTRERSHCAAYSPVTYGTDLPYGVSIVTLVSGQPLVPGGTGLRQSQTRTQNSIPVLNDQAVFNVFMI